jgi:hypothetical protein
LVSKLVKMLPEYELPKFRTFMKATAPRYQAPNAGPF